MPAQKLPMLSGTASFLPRVRVKYQVSTCNPPEFSISLFVDNRTQVDGNPTVLAEFKINMFNISGLKVDALNIAGEQYKPYKASPPHPLSP